MKKICLFVVGLYINLLGIFAQEKDSTNYKRRKLKLEEINFVSSYYKQDGNNSAITGGKGTERLADYSNSFEVKLIKHNKHNRKISIEANLGVDYYTSASSDKIDPFTISSASARDLRIYPSVIRTVTNEEKGSSVITSLSYSHESDYRSYGLGAGIIKKSKDNNSEFNVRAQLYLDWVEIILPIELRTAVTGGLPDAPNEYDYPWKRRNTLSTAFSFSKIINQRLQLMWLMDLTYQKGFLSLPFHRVYFKDNVLATELLPSSRFKIPLGFRANYFPGDKLVLRSFFRFYKDDWGLNAYTAELETSIKPTAFFSISPFYRYYHQTAIDFFAGYREHDGSEPFYSSNFDYSKFSSHFFGAGVRLIPLNGIFGRQNWNMIELRYGHYKRSNGLHAGILSLHFKYK